MATVNVLIVGGGGGGGGIGGGGGGGGYISDTTHAVTPQAYSVGVGAAGAAGTGSAHGGNGGDSTFDGLTAVGGGGGGGNGTTAQAGGSGGGGQTNADSSHTGGAGTVGQGNNGGTSSARTASGGGGAGSVGVSNLGSDLEAAGANGGSPTSNSISGSAKDYSGGGGGGGMSQAGSIFAGGVGGGTFSGGSGGNVDDSTPSSAGATNSGGGGGGGGYNAGTGHNGSAGGSGVVVIRYTVASGISATGGTITTSGTDTVHTFTAPGTFTILGPKPSGFANPFPNPTIRIPTPQKLSIEFSNHPIFFTPPPPPLPQGKSILFPNPVLRLVRDGGRWSFTNSTPLGLYSSYFPLATDVIFTINGTDVHSYVKMESIEINDYLNEQPNTCTFKINSSQPSVGQTVQVGLGSLDSTRLIFAGTITNVKQIYESSPALGASNIAWVCDCLDYTFLLNRRRPTGIYTSVSASTVFTSLITNFSSGFTSGVPSGLPTVSISFDGSLTFAQCLTDLCNTIGYKWKVDYGRVLRVFITADGSAPTTIDATNTTTQVNPIFEYDIDLTQIRTRVVGKGKFKNLLSDVNASETILPVGDSTVFSSIGGSAYLGPIPITYTGTQSSVATGAFVGNGTGPSVAPSLANVAGAGLSSGTYLYEYTFITPAGESLPSPVGSVVTGAISGPSVGAVILAVGHVGSLLDLGSHDYVVTFVTPTGETTPGPPTGTITALELADPGAIPPTSITTNAGFYTTLGPAAGTVVTAAIFWVDSQFAAMSAVGTSTITYTTVANGPGVSMVDVVVPGTNSPNVAYISITFKWASGGNIYFYDSSVANPGAGNSASIFCIPGRISGGAFAPFSNIPRRRAQISSIPLGSSTVTSRKVYRRFNGSGTYKLAATIADNTTDFLFDDLANSSLGVAAPSVNTAFANQVQVTGIASGPSPTSSRKLYRTVVGGSQGKLLTTFADNTTSSYLDSTADASLGANAPSGDTSGLSTAVINGAGFYSSSSVSFSTNGAATNATTASPVFTSASYTFVSADVGAYLFIKSGVNWTPGSYLIVSVAAGAATLSGQCATVASPTAATWGVDYSGLVASRYSFTDMVIDAATATKFTSAAFPVGVNFIGNVIAISSSIGFISQRVIVLSISGVIATCDKIIGTLSATGGSGNLGGAAVATFVAAGSTSLIVASTGPFFSTGGWALNGSNYIRYTGFSTTALTGIPSSGIGSITASINYGATLTSIDAVIGCSGVLATLAGTNLQMAIQLDDTDSQTLLAALEGGDGIHEYVFTDSEAADLTALTAEAQAVLDTFKEVLVTITEGARDINTNAGKDLVVNLPSPMSISVTVTIQSVRITNVGTERGQYPLFVATAASAKYTLQDLIRQLGTLVSNQ